ncbi:hypothetical protein L218DRAFT_580733 [Marasmius fiardii PR-910]|nr:hypothetical protein L218DRAFT_580733 [Marasmius fiardii PR-910]
MSTSTPSAYLTNAIFLLWMLRCIQTVAVLIQYRIVALNGSGKRLKAKKAPAYYFNVNASRFGIIRTRETTRHPENFSSIAHLFELSANNF